MLSIWDSFADLNRFQREVERNFSGRKAVAEFAVAHTRAVLKLLDAVPTG